MHPINIGIKFSITSLVEKKKLFPSYFQEVKGILKQTQCIILRKTDLLN